MKRKSHFTWLRSLDPKKGQKRKRIDSLHTKATSIFICGDKTLQSPCTPSACLNQCSRYCVVSCLYFIFPSATEGGWRLCLHPCLFVCQQDISKSCWLDFGEDLDSRIFFKLNLHHWVMGPKTIYRMIFQKSCGRGMTKLGGWVGLVTRRSGLDDGSRLDPDPASQRDTKRKLFSLAKVCALPSAVRVLSSVSVHFHFSSETQDSDLPGESLCYF